MKLCAKFGRLWIAACAAVLVFSVFSSAPAPAAQGSGIGTLPVATKRVGWLTSGQVLTMRSGEITFCITSRTEGTEALVPPPPPPAPPQILKMTWKWHGCDMSVETPRYESESGPNGEERWMERHARACERALQQFPRDIEH